MMGAKSSVVVVVRRVDPARVYDYLRGGMTDRGDGSMLESIRQVPAGSWTTIRLRDLAPPSFTPFFVPIRRETLDISFDEAVSKTRDLFVESEARSVGVGESIADLIVAFCTAAKCVGIDAYALPGARTAKNFFERSGFTARALVMHHKL